MAFRPLDPNLLEELGRYGFPYPAADFETLSVDEYQCPECLSLDRDRLYAMYLREYLDSVGERDTELLEFAPSAVLRKVIDRRKSVNYRNADLYRSDVDDQVDLTDMSCYSNGQFDFVICSHVLEHVDDDGKALAELRRVLKPGGRAILMVPILEDPNVFDEDPGVTDEAERWRRFGQFDHVRLYSKDVFLRRLADAGFEIAQLGADHFGPEKFRRNGITQKSVLYVVTNPSS